MAFADSQLDVCIQSELNAQFLLLLIMFLYAMSTHQGT